MLTGCLRHTPDSCMLNETTLSSYEEALDSPFFCEEDFKDTWWCLFKDPALDKLICMGLDSSPTMAIAEKRMALAQNFVKEAQSTLLPHLEFLGNIKRNEVSEFGSLPPPELVIYSEATFSLNAVYQLDLWGKNRSKILGSMSHYQAEKANQEAVKLYLTTAIAENYFQWQMDQVLLEINQNKLKDKKERYFLLQSALDHGTLATEPLFLLDQEVVVVENQIESLMQGIAFKKHALQALIGASSLDTLNEICPRATIPTVFPIPQCLPCNLISRRPDIQAYKWLIQESVYDVKIKQADFYPNIDLLGFVGTQSIRLSKLFTAPTLITLLDAALNLPVFTAGKLQAKLGIAKDSLDIAIEQYNQSILNAVKEVSDALTELINTNYQYINSNRGTKDANKIYQLHEQMYHQGLNTLNRVLLTKEEVATAREQETLIDLKRYLAAVHLIQAIGGGYDARRDQQQ